MAPLTLALARNRMNIRHTGALVTLAALLLAGLPVASNAGVVVSARAVHTGVHPHARTHRHHARHHAAPHAELRAAAQHGAGHTRRGAPAIPHPRPGRSHALPAHAGTQLRRSPSRGGVPYALGPASLSLGLWTDGTPMRAMQNDGATDPRLGILKGRSPPRGDTPCAIRCPTSARPALTPRAPAPAFGACCISKPAAECLAATLPDPVLTHSFGFRVHRSTPGPVGVRRPQRLCAARETPSACTPCFAPSVIPITPDRAFEGRAAGPTLPSRRKFV